MIPRSCPFFFGDLNSSTTSCIKTFFAIIGSSIFALDSSRIGVRQDFLVGCVSCSPGLQVGGRSRLWRRSSPAACDFYLRVRRKPTKRIRGERGFKIGSDYREGLDVVVDRVGPTRILSCIRYVGLKTLIISRFITAVESAATAVPAHELSRYMPHRS